MFTFFIYFFLVIRSEWTIRKQQFHPRETCRSKFSWEKLSGQTEAAGMAHGYHGSMVCGELCVGISELPWIWVGRWPRLHSRGKISAPSSSCCSPPGWSQLTCLLCASRFPVSCAMKSYPWSRIIVKKMVKYFHLTNHCVFYPWYTNPGSKTWPMLTHLTLNTRYYC